MVGKAPYLFVFTSSNDNPIFSESNFCAFGTSPNIPIEPVSVAGFAKIRFAPQDR